MCITNYFLQNRHIVNQIYLLFKIENYKMRDVMLIVHFIGIAMTVGYIFVLAFQSLASSKMDDKEADNFRLSLLNINILGNIGIGVLILSGGYLMTPYWKMLSFMPLLIVKLVLVLVLAGLIGFLGATGKKAKKENNLALLSKIDLLTKLSFAISMVIVILAVLVFH